MPQGNGRSFTAEEPRFRDEDSARAFVESRAWPEGPTCPRCGGSDRIGKLTGQSTRQGTYKCYRCRKPFTVKIGTIFEATHLPLHLWLQAIYLVGVRPAPVRLPEMRAVLGVAPGTAALVTHRIRKGLRRAASRPAQLAPEFMPFESQGMEATRPGQGDQEREILLDDPFVDIAATGDDSSGADDQAAFEFVFAQLVPPRSPTRETHPPGRAAGAASDKRLHRQE
jgi:transposase-like protein